MASPADTRAIEWLKESVSEGRHWYVALLEAIRLWGSSEEEYRGRHYRYLVGGEAFDWLLLAERLCQEIDGFVPEEELANLLFLETPPTQLTRKEFQDLIGVPKYQAHLNYQYGVLVEKYLPLAVSGEIRKKKRALGLNGDAGTIDEAYQQIYGATQGELLTLFRKERRYRRPRSIGLSELDEYTYWLFKYRMKRRDKSCVASDTKKALNKLKELSRSRAKLGQFQLQSSDPVL